MMRSNCKRIMRCAVLATLLANTMLDAASAQTTPIFQIGKFDRSSGEFASGNPTHNVDFIISKSDPAKDWFSVQPAVLGATEKLQTAPIASAPRSITYTLEGAPANNYRLHIALLIENASVPALKVDINGKSGMFYLHPRLDYSNGDQWDSFDPAQSSADIEFDFPGSYLHRGVNRISFEMVEEAEEAVPDAGLTYDAIELDSVPRKAASDGLQTKVVPTIFFQEQNGELLENVVAFIRHSTRSEPGSKAELSIGERHYHAALRGGQDFGEEKIEFLVKEFALRSEAQLSVEIDGRKQHSKQMIDPAKKWTIFIVPHIHVDVGYSDYQAKVAAIQSRTIGEAMEMTEKHPDFRFSLDGEWDLQQFLETRTPVQQQRAIAAIQKEQLFVPAQYANLLTGIPATETLIRSLYPSANFSRKYGTPFNYANITDVPTFSWSYASILSSAGINYLASGSDNYRAPVLLQGRLNEHSPMWWAGPDGKKILLWYSRHYMHMQMLFGLPPLLAAGRDTLPQFLQMYDTPQYHANATILFGTQVENSDLFPQQAELAGKWNSRYAYPHLQYSGFYEALQNIEKQFGDNIPTIRGDGGPYWEDGAASDAYTLAIERWTEARGLTAEKLDTLAALVNPLLKTDTAELGRMWTLMVLAEEHTYDSSDSVSDPTSSETVDQHEFKMQYAVNAAALVDFVARRSMANLADAIPATLRSGVFFNTLNWKRNELVSVDLPKGLEIVDPLTNQSVPYELLSKGNDFNRIRFIVRDLPPLGYRVYTTRPANVDVPSSESVSGEVLESPYYRVQLDAETGSVSSIYDKQLQRELVEVTSPYRFGQYLYVTGGDGASNTLLVYSHALPKPKLEVHSAHGGRIVSILRTPYGMVARMESEGLNTPSIKTEIRLFDDEKKIEFVEDVNKKEVFSKESVYFAFPFAFSHPQFQFEVQNGVVDPAKDMYPGAGHEWFTVQHWVSVQQESASGSLLPLDAPLVTLGEINRGAWPEQFGTRPGTIFSYVMNNYWNTNYRAGQGGDFRFHYVVTSATATSASDLSRMGWEEITPVETDIITSQDKALPPPTADNAAISSVAPAGKDATLKMDGKRGSFLEITDPNVLLETWKPAEDENGTILRLLEFGGTERTISVRIPWLHVDHVWQTDAVERGQQAVSLSDDGEFHFTIHPHEIVTLRVVGTRQ